MRLKQIFVNNKTFSNKKTFEMGNRFHGGQSMLSHFSIGKSGLERVRHVAVGGTDGQCPPK